MSAWTPEQFEVAKDDDKTRFHDLDLPHALLRGIQDLGFEYCSPIQAESLPLCLDGYDMIGKAQTGTGKTAAFLINLIDTFLRDPRPNRKPGAPRALVLAPTRELVMQIAKDAEGLCKHTDLNVQEIVGGIDYQKQRDDLRAGPCDIMVATPGRLIDFLRQNEVNLRNVEILVLDEADRMLDMGFIPDVRRIVRACPHREKRQTILYSATFSQAIMDLVERWTVDPKSVIIEPDSVATDTVEQIVYITTTDEKYNLLKNLILKRDLHKVMVFANRRTIVNRLSTRLQKDGIEAAELSGDVPQKKRISTLENFKNGRVRVLVATDVAGRGIHIDGVGHVVNFTLPEEAEDYVHRIGRTGRAGAEGTSISFADEEDGHLIPEIEGYINRKLPSERPSEDLLG